MGSHGACSGMGVGEWPLSIRWNEGAGVCVCGGGANWESLSTSRHTTALSVSVDVRNSFSMESQTRACKEGGLVGPLRVPRDVPSLPVIMMCAVVSRVASVWHLRAHQCRALFLASTGAAFPPPPFLQKVNG